MSIQLQILKGQEGRANRFLRHARDIMNGCEVQRLGLKSTKR